MVAVVRIRTEAQHVPSHVPINLALILDLLRALCLSIISEYVIIVGREKGKSEIEKEPSQETSS